MSFTFHDVDFIWDKYYPTQRATPWIGHRHFAYDLIRFMKPGRIVELGTHCGTSFLAFCQAMRDEGVAGECIAVDNWVGDRHNGFYGGDVYETLSKVAAEQFPGMAILNRCTFDEAASQFAEQSIDVLHLDGLHTLEAVSHDYETWLPKLRDNGVVLFHDTHVKEGDFGVYKLWEDLKNQSPYLEFDHSYGLGVLFPKGCAASFSKWIHHRSELSDLYRCKATCYSQSVLVEDLIR